MSISTTLFLWIASILLVLNLSVVLIVKSEKRFLIPIALWAILLITSFLLKHVNDGNIQQQAKAYYDSMGAKQYGDFKIWENVQAEESYGRALNLALFRLFGIQTLMTLIIQIIAYRETQKQHLFWWTRTSFIALMILYLFFEVILHIAPTGPFV